jgi:PIN domain nuclease of toxin-antitoxin system
MSEVIVLDTHIWLWFINGNLDRFPSHWLNLIESASRVGISPVSCYEIALAHSRGRIELPGTAQEWFEESLMTVGIELFPMTEVVAARAVELSPVHKDPFDRLIIATALVYGAKLASIDSLFSQYPELDLHLLK